MQRIGWVIIFCVGVLVSVGGYFYLYGYPATSKTIYTKMGGEFNWTACWFSPIHSVRYRCAYYTPADASETNPVRLAVVVIRNKYTSFSTQPILYIHGGPGGPTNLVQDNVDYWADWMRQSDWPYDLVLYDQRGVGMSTPKVQCDYVSQFKKYMTQDLDIEQEGKIYTDWLKACYSQLKQQKLNLENINSKYAAKDAIGIMASMSQAVDEYTQWNIYGVSYGTRVGLNILRRKPGNIHSAMLDSVYPANVHGTLTSPKLFYSALKRYAAYCEQKQCAELKIDFQQLFNRLLRRYSAQPFLYKTTSLGNEKFSLLINETRFINIIYSAMYDRDLLENMPGILLELESGNHDAIKPLADYYLDFMLDESFSDAVYTQIECADERNNYSEQKFSDSIRQAKQYSRFFKGLYKNYACHFWQAQDIGEQYRQSVESEVPVLVLSGELDPVTPVIWAAQVAGHLTYVTHVQANGIGHDVIGSDQCMSDYARSFLSQPENRHELDCGNDAEFVSTN